MDSISSRPGGARLPGPEVSALPSAARIAQRFTLRSLVGQGGMGEVYRAEDVTTGQQVALKLLRAESPEALQRFAREASMLAGLEHPGIVTYVAHGQAEDGRPFLAMQWLEGEDLAQRLVRQPLSLQETLALLHRVAQALAVAHGRGIIHRDLKPSNLFLRQGQPGDAVLLDFGLARSLAPSVSLTASQTILGTPGYMAPEQVSHRAGLTPSADIFSLGCVLYECLTGSRPFAAPHLVAVLAKILFTEPEPLRSLRPELPEALEELLRRTLAKDPAHRLPDASRLVAALEALPLPGAAGPSAPSVAESPLPGLVQAEQQLVSVLLATSRTPPPPAGEHGHPWHTLHGQLRTWLSPHGGQVEPMADGSLALTLVALHGSATDSAVLAARCALLIQEHVPGTAVVLTTGQGRREGRGTVGEAMDRAGQLLQRLEQLPAGGPAPVVMDDVTEGLLGTRFPCTRSPSGLFLLQGAPLGVDDSRPLLGKPTPCVGREQELAQLELLFHTCVRESSAQAVLVKGPAGMGKSRLRHEFMRRLEREQRPVQVLLGRGDPMRAGSAQGLLGQALCQLCGLTGLEPLELRRERLQHRLARHLPPEAALETTAFLGELCGTPFPDEAVPRLQAVRGNPQQMSAQVSRALGAFLRAECAHHPVLLVLEDLHWGDTLTARLVDEALRDLKDQPFMVLALARPGVEQALPELGAPRMRELPLHGLNARAAARLAREVLGTKAPGALVDRLVEQASGNPLYLEELIRGEAEGQGTDVPRTVLAMLQARLGRLEPQARQVLLAASFLGRLFWTGGVRALLGEESAGTSLERWLQQLVELELVEAHPTSRFPGEREYRFRHALVRDAAYELVPSGDKPTGHRRAGLWLEQAGENDPQVLAGHFRSGQWPARAIHFYSLAAEHLFDRHDMQGMQRCMEAAWALEPDGEAGLRLRALQATAAFWMDDFITMTEAGKAVLPHLQQGSAAWSKLISGLSLGCAQLGQREYLLGLHRLLLETAPEPEARSDYFLAVCFMGSMVAYFGDRQEAQACFDHLEAQGRDILARDSVVRGWRNIVYCFRDLYLLGEPQKALAWSEQAESSLQDAGAERDEVAAFTWSAHALLKLGNPESAQERARRGMALALRVGQPFPITHARHTLALVLSASPEPAHLREARELVREWVEPPSLNRVHLGSAYLVLARVAAGEGQKDEALEQARKACDVLEPFRPFRALARWSLAALLWRQGHVAEARLEAENARRHAAVMGGEGVAGVGPLQLLADACFAQGDTAAGEQALHQALAYLRSRLQGISDAAGRERFLSQVPENARVLELVRQRWGDAALP
ncbi:Serine/threonine protein kinase [Stigmatella aurantiaca]|uniref:Serine/threonine protein kinase n=1 Tax=Stigmatella aurantiaca TaxID=41 RepID=A0A1H7I124_STIAU|nr:serine/threonine-protein kinase [Stigmatella aurantiaca]SEK55562.1 Serine/threonine protein kinase [Stigmatella aurantiaca]